ncbi:DUF1178 family protein [Parvularcula dongshanensis]|uniref:DUF1178 family protein n=1 Tax=Parvularcula dongshanensis TaxID=1173995 RepID=A0A840I3B7_9PROT|nr:DUF1178 family protein [Parvularcula dongshanensis]MBB4658792.1 hypothetical protein [Parvularcula dongshanensis]
MIKYALKCDDAHRFEGWFSNSADYDAQAQKGLLACPVCGSSEVGKALMAPYVATSRRSEAAAEERLSVVRQAINESARKARDYVHKNFEGVGKRFPEEARKIHYGEAKDRPIYGEATPDEAKALVEEGVTIAPLPQPEPTPDEVKKKLN